MKRRKHKVFRYQPSRFRITAPSPDSIQVEALGALFHAPPHPVRRSRDNHAKPSPPDLQPGPQAPVGKTDLRTLLVRKHAIEREKAKADEGKKEDGQGGSTERRRESAFERLGGRLEGSGRTPGEEKGRPDESVETLPSDYSRQQWAEENGSRVGESARGTKRSLEVGGASDRGSLEVPGVQKRAKVSPVFSRLTLREDVGRQPEEKRGSDRRGLEAPAITQGGKKAGQQLPV